MKYWMRNLREKLKSIYGIMLSALVILTIQTQSFADRNSQSLDNIDSSQINKDNRTETINGVTTRNDNTVDYFICLLIVVLTGKIARVIFALSIFAWGILFFMGKVSWQIFVITAVGIGLVFGAVSIVIAILPRATQVIDTSGDTAKIVTKTPSQMIREKCPEIGY